MPINMLVWNMEWMNDLFVSGDQPAAFRADTDVPAHAKGTTIAQRRADLSGVLDALAPDLVVLVEGPNRTDELQLFFDTDVEGDWVTFIQPSPGMSQCVGVAARVDQGRFASQPLTPIPTTDDPRFGPFELDTDEDDVNEVHKFERRPLYVEVHPQDGASFRVLGLHLKSKGIFDALEWSRWWQRAEGDRRKLLAQATRIRLQFLDPYFDDPHTRDVPLIVCGDINDGPGMDAAEKRIRGSAIERLMGTVWNPAHTLGNALFDVLSASDRANLLFDDIQTTSFKDPIFNNVWHRVWIDHLLYSRRNQPWVTQAQVRERMPDDAPIWQAFPHASDHFPITATLTT